MWLYVFVCVYYSLCLQIGADPATWVLYDFQTKINPLTPFLFLKPHNFPYNLMISGLNIHFHRRTCYVPRPRCSVLCPQVYRELIDVKGQPSHRGTILALKLKASRTDRGPSLHDGFQIAHYAGVDEKQTRNTWHNMGMLIWPSVIWHACRCYRFWWIFSQLCRRAFNKKWQIPPNSGGLMRRYGWYDEILHSASLPPDRWPRDDGEWFQVLCPTPPRVGSTRTTTRRLPCHRVRLLAMKNHPFVDDNNDDLQTH